MSRRRSYHNLGYLRYGLARNLEAWTRRPLKKKKDFKKYCSELLKESSITGVASTINSDGWFRKLIKLIIIFFGVAGFLLQTHDFLQLYWEYSTIENAQRMSHMKKPAITVCDENLIRRKYLCETTDRCTIYNSTKKSSVCIMYSPYCTDPNDYYSGVPPGVLRTYPEEFFAINFTEASGFEIEKNLLECEWFSKSTSSSCGKPKFVRAVTQNNLPAACYTLKPSAHVDGEELHHDSVLRMMLRWHASDYIKDTPTVILSTTSKESRHYYIAFHYAGHVTNPFFEGFRVEERKTYKVQVTQLDRIRMPPPYSTNCHDYIEEWMKNGRKGPLTREGCQAYCEIDIEFQAFGCVPADVEYPHEKKLCTGYKSFDQSLNSKIQECIGECRDACLDTEYVTKSEITGQIALDAALKKYNSSTVVILEVFFDTLKSKTTKYSPKYESIELFSYIGGYLGMWLGWSLVAIFDFIEIIFNVCKYPFMKKKRVNRKAAVQPFI